MAGLLQKFRGWWGKDTLERADEETRMTQQERDVVEEDYEARKDDVAAERWEQLGDADYERDSERPR